MKTTIFEGKERFYNTQILTLLFDNGPLTTWELVGKLTDKNKYSMNATLTRSLKKLAEKKFLHKEGKAWFLGYKGMLGAIIEQETPKIWNPKWKEVFNHNAKVIKKSKKPELPFLGLTDQKIEESLNFIGKCLDDFTTWKEFSFVVKNLIDEGIINFDRISDKYLLALIIAKIVDVEQFSKIINPSKID